MVDHAVAMNIIKIDTTGESTHIDLDIEKLKVQILKQLSTNSETQLVDVHCKKNIVMIHERLNSCTHFV